MTEDELHLAAARAGDAPRDRRRRSSRGALYLPGDEVVHCLFESASRASVKRVSELAGMPCERVIETVRVAPEAKGDQL